MDLKLRKQLGLARRTVLFVVVGAFMLAGGIWLLVSGDSKKQTNTNKGYLVISEWGVKAPSDESLQLSYKIYGNEAHFSSKALTKIDSSCKGQGGVITRYAPSDTLNNPGGTALTTGVGASRLMDGKGFFSFTEDNSGTDVDFYGDKYSYKYLDGYYYVFSPNQGSCSLIYSPTSSMHETVNSTVKLMVLNLEPEK